MFLAHYRGSTSQTVVSPLLSGECGLELNSMNGVGFSSKFRPAATVCDQFCQVIKNADSLLIPLSHDI